MSSEAGWDKWLREQRPPRTLLVRGGDKCWASSPHSWGNSEALRVSQAPQHGSPAQLTHPALTSVLSHVPSQCPQLESKSSSQDLLLGKPEMSHFLLLIEIKAPCLSPAHSPGPPSCSLLAGNPISIGKSETGPTKGNKPEDGHCLGSWGGKRTPHPHPGHRTCRRKPGR